MDLYKLTPEEFRKYAGTRDFEDMPINDKFTLVWLRLKRDERVGLIRIIRENSLDDIINSEELKDKILLLYKEARYITLDIKIMVSQIDSWNDRELPLEHIG